MYRRIAYYVLYVLIVVAIIVGIAYALNRGYPGDTPDKTTPGSSITQTSPKLANNNPSTQKQPAANSSTSGSSSSSNKSTSTTKQPTTGKPSNGTAANSSQLTNSGPGDVLAIFLGAVVVGTIGFSRYQRKNI